MVLAASALFLHTAKSPINHAILFYASLKKPFPDVLHQKARFSDLIRLLTLTQLSSSVSGQLAALWSGVVSDPTSFMHHSTTSFWSLHERHLFFFPPQHLYIVFSLFFVSFCFCFLMWQCCLTCSVFSRCFPTFERGHYFDFFSLMFLGIC